MLFPTHRVLAIMGFKNMRQIYSNASIQSLGDISLWSPCLEGRNCLTFVKRELDIVKGTIVHIRGMWGGKKTTDGGCLGIV